MKKLLLSIAVIAMLFTACNEKKTDKHGHDHTDGTHQHEDGQVHESHLDEMVSQEEFTVSNDSVAAKEAHDHEYENGEKHEH
jgi:Ni/Co efflux regulator RcnB